MSGDKITYGRVTNSTVAFGRGATSTTAEDRAPSGSPDSAEDRTTARAADATRRAAAGGRGTTTRNFGDIDGRAVAVGRGASATRRGRDGRERDGR